MTQNAKVLPINDNITLQQNAVTQHLHMPHDIEIEQSLLGALMVDQRCIEKVNEFLEEKHFYVPLHQRLYEYILKLHANGMVPTPNLLKGFFDKDEDLQGVGGPAYLADLLSAAVSTANATDYGKTIHECFVRRQLITLADDLIERARTQDIDDPAKVQIEHAESQLYNLAQFGEFKGGFVSLAQSAQIARERAERAFNTVGHVTGVTTGLRDLDAKLGGLHNSDLIILAGRPSMGKTALATNIAVNAAKAYVRTNGKEGAKVGFFSLEMSAEQLATRIISEVSEVSSHKIRMGEVRQDEFMKFAQAASDLAELPLYIDDTAAFTIGSIRARARRLQRQHGLGLIVVDYLQLLGGSSRRSQENRVQEVSEISRGLKTLAKELNVPVIALSQLARGVEQRENKRPQLSDLRESGSIEQDADVVMFVYREEYYLERDKPAQTGSEKEDSYIKRVQFWEERVENARNVAECVIGKQRHGPIGIVPMHFNGMFTRFSNLEGREYKILEE
jgi:replicative DNA helicase